MKISVVIPTLNEEANIQNTIKMIPDYVDEIIVVDSGSTDMTQAKAERSGATFYYAADIRSELGDALGKGENLWKSQFVTTGDIIVYLDADLFNISPEFIDKLVEPLIKQTNTKFVKSYFDRSHTPYGGRVTELTAKPMLNIFYPQLSQIHQPLSGQVACYAEVLQHLKYPQDYGVEVSHLIDIYHSFGIDAIDQVFLGRIVHRNRNLESLKPTATSVANIIVDKAYEHGHIKTKLVENINYRNPAALKI